MYNPDNDGYLVAPTSTDYMYAAQYANDKLKKAACDARPDMYTWVPTLPRYPCPPGLTCEPGTCKFTESGCRAKSQLPYHDCLRRTVTCDTHPSGNCEVCDYSISLGRTISGPEVDPPHEPNSSYEGCSPGDIKYAPYVPHPFPLFGERADATNEFTSGQGCHEVLEAGGNNVCAAGSVCVMDASDLYTGACVFPCTTNEDCPVGTGTVCGTDPDDTGLYHRCHTPPDSVIRPLTVAPLDPLRACTDGDATAEPNRCDPGFMCVTDATSVAFGQCVMPCDHTGTISMCDTISETAVCANAASHPPTLVENTKDVHGYCAEPRDAVPLCSLQPYPEQPYTVAMYVNDDGDEVEDQTVPCKTDDDCAILPGVGGVCGRDPAQTATYRQCFFPHAFNDSSYLEWRHALHQWDDMPPVENVCVSADPDARKWCEMPWTRQGSDEDDPSSELQDRVRKAWKTKARPPFYYNDSKGSCHVTKTYCTANLKDGGFSAGYGRDRSYWLGSVCSGDTNKEVVEGYDCCTTIDRATGEFFLGRTLTTDLWELAEGDVEGPLARHTEYSQRFGDALHKLGIPKPAINYVSPYASFGELHKLSGTTGASG